MSRSQSMPNANTRPAPKPCACPSCACLNYADAGTTTCRMCRRDWHREMR